MPAGGRHRNEGQQVARQTLQRGHPRLGAGQPGLEACGQPLRRLVPGLHGKGDGVEGGGWCCACVLCGDPWLPCWGVACEVPFQAQATASHEWLACTQSVLDAVMPTTTCLWTAEAWGLGAGAVLLAKEELMGRQGDAFAGPGEQHPCRCLIRAWRAGVWRGWQTKGVGFGWLASEQGEGRGLGGEAVVGLCAEPCRKTWASKGRQMQLLISTLGPLFSRRTRSSPFSPLPNPPTQHPPRGHHLPPPQPPLLGGGPPPCMSSAPVCRCSTTASFCSTSRTSTFVSGSRAAGLAAPGCDLGRGPCGALLSRFCSLMAGKCWAK